MLNQIKREWLYTPTTGTKLVMQKFQDNIKLVTYKNGSHDIFYRGSKISWHAAEPGNYYRDAIKQFVSAFIKQSGGILVDDCGVVEAYVPPQHQWALFSMAQNFITALGKNWSDLHQSATLLMAEGLAGVKLGGFATAPQYHFLYLYDEYKGIKIEQEHRQEQTTQEQATQDLPKTELHGHLVDQHGSELGGFIWTSSLEVESIL